MPAEKTVKVDGLNVRYLEEGTGKPVILLHGASLGSSADVWKRNLRPLAAHGLRVIAYDQPGFGLTDNPKDQSTAYREQLIIKFMDALRLDKASLVGHSQAGGMALNLAFTQTARMAKVIGLGSGSLLPPLGEGQGAGAGEGTEGTASEPTPQDVRAILENNLFNHSLITPEVLAERHKMSVGKNFQAFLQRREGGRGGGGGGIPLWQRLDKVPVPLLLIYGKNDRGKAAERAALARERYPRLNLHVIDRCRHLVQWDAQAEFEALAGKFLAV